jgi:surface antigen
MQRTTFAAAIAVAFLALTSPSHAWNCVAYAKQATGFALSGDAWQWWDSAAASHARGDTPASGAVMVFARTRHMRHGHVAVVRAVRGPREILIDQANWQAGRRKGSIDRAVSAIDISDRNDWSAVRVQWARTGSYGRVNPVRGFIYAAPPAASPSAKRPRLEARLEESAEPPARD